MKLIKTILQPKWIALALVIIIPAIVNQLFFDKRSYKAYSTDFKNTTEVILVIIIWLVGNYGLKNLKTSWPLSIWKAVYVTSIVILTIMTLIEAFIYHYSYKGQFRFMSIKQMLFSPLLYVLLLIIEANFAKKKNA